MPRSALLVTYSLELGGTQRASVFLAETLVGAGWRTLLFLCADRPRAFRPPPAVDVIEGWRAKERLASLGTLGRSTALAMALRSVLRRQRPQLLLALGNTPGVLALAAAAGMRIPVIVSDRVAPLRDEIERGPWRLAVRLLYPRAAHLVAPSEGILGERPWMPRSRSVVIPNAVRLEEGAGAEAGTLEAAGEPHVLALGRLHRQKGFDLLIEAFRGLALRHPAWHLTIVGEGPERARLERLARDFDLSARIHLPGASAQPGRLLRAAARNGNIFAFPSRYEGFPNALIEAMACGLPVVAADCPHGPREILEGGAHGLLVPPEDPKALAAGLAALMGDPARREDLAARARRRAEAYAPDRIARLWLDLVERTVAEARA